jgi:sugar phosphate isomerase/epimerase
MDTEGKKRTKKLPEVASSGASVNRRNDLQWNYLGIIVLAKPLKCIILSRHSRWEKFNFMNRRQFIRQTAASVFLGAAATLAPSGVQGAEAPMGNPFFAMDTGTRDERHRTPESQARMLKELGYAGVGWSPGEVPEMLAALDREGLRMFNVYIGVDIDGVNRTTPETILKLIELLKGRDTAIWLTVTSKKYPKPSDEAGDEDAVAMLRDIADRSQTAHLKVALYPHAGAWIERTQDAVRLARKIDRKNLGVTFNLCHCLKVGDEARIAEILELARPFLFFVSINGADHKGDWDRLIQPLGQGEFDVASVLKNLKKIGYRGPIGLQHYGVKGDVNEKLKQSMDGWRKLSAQVE